MEGGKEEGEERLEEGRHRGVVGWERWVNGWMVGGRGYWKVQRVRGILESGENASGKKKEKT